MAYGLGFGVLDLEPVVKASEFGIESSGFRA